MTSKNLPFSLAEYEARLAKVRTAMDGAGCDVLLLTDPANMAWLTGYEGWSFYVHQGVLIGPSGVPIWWGPDRDESGWRSKAVLSRGDIFSPRRNRTFTPSANFPVKLSRHAVVARQGKDRLPIPGSVLHARLPDGPDKRLSRSGLRR